MWINKWHMLCRVYKWNMEQEKETFIDEGCVKNWDSIVNSLNEKHI